MFNDSNLLHLKTKQEAQRLMSVKLEMRKVLKEGLQIPELQTLNLKLNSLDHQLNEVLISRARLGRTPIDIGAESVEIEDLLEEGLSSHQRLRRTQAKKLARKLYSIYHDDHKSSGRIHGITFALIRDLAKEGEIELLTFLRACHSEEVVHDCTVTNTRQLVRNRLLILQATLGFKITQKFFSDRDGYIECMSVVLKRRIRSLEEKLAEMYLPD